MKVKIEADLKLNETETLKAISKALLEWEVAELMKAFPAGEHFKMESQAGNIVITKL
jgi:hypothetical protein